MSAACARGFFNDSFGFVRLTEGVNHHLAVRGVDAWQAPTRSWASPSVLSVSAAPTQSANGEAVSSAKAVSAHDHVAVWYAGTTSQYVFINRAETLSPLWIARLPYPTIVITGLVLLNANTLVALAADGSLYVAVPSAEHHAQKKGKQFHVVEAVKASTGKGSNSDLTGVVAIAAVTAVDGTAVLAVVTRRDFILAQIVSSDDSVAANIAARSALPAALAKDVTSAKASPPLVHIASSTNADGILALHVPGTSTIFIAHVDAIANEVSAFQAIDLGSRSTLTAPLPLVGPFGTIGVVVAKEDGSSDSASQEWIVFVTVVKSSSTSTKSGKKGAASTTAVFDAVVLAPLALPQGRSLTAWTPSSGAAQGRQRRRHGSVAAAAAPQESISLFTTATSGSSAAAASTLESAVFSLSNEGLPTQLVLDNAQWQTILTASSDTSPLIPSPAGATDDSDAKEEEVSTGATFAAIRKGSAAAGEPLAAFVYPAKLGNDIALFRVSARQYALHSKLATQWAEGGDRLTQRLRGAIGASSVADVADLLEHRFHPSHLRLALRRLGADELVTLFTLIVDRLSVPTAHLHLISSAATAARSNHKASSMMTATPNGADIALHIITLHRQLGLELPAESVSKLVELLQEVRRMGHQVGGAAARLQSMLSALTAASALSAATRRGDTSLQLDSAWGKDASGSRGVQVRYTTRPESAATADANGPSVAGAAAELLRRALSQATLQELQRKASATAANAHFSTMIAYE